MRLFWQRVIYCVMMFLNIVIILAFLSYIIGLIWIDISKYEISSSKIPQSFDGYTILQLSDLHSKSFGKNQEKLMKKNVYVYMTRTKDETLSLEDRVNYSNEINPDIFVSIHANSTVNADSYGLETHYFKDNSYKLAQIVHNDFASYKNLKKWETIDRGVIKSRFYVINHTEAPAILIEMGFISNSDERAKLTKKGRKEDIAESITDGILEYLKKKWLIIQLDY